MFNPSVARRDPLARQLRSPDRNGILLSAPILAYEVSRQIQWRICRERIANVCPDTLVLLEHEPVITLGRTTKTSHWNEHKDVLTQENIPIIECERGGSVTYHGPGQLVGYPILRLRDFCSGPKTYMRMLEEVMIRVLREWGIEGHRVEKWVGVWVQDPKNPDGTVSKIAAMGVKITHGVTMHGFALNVTVEMKPFEHIVPCGIEGCRVTSLANLLGAEPDLEQVREKIAHHFADVFGIEWTSKKPLALCS